MAENNSDELQFVFDNYHSLINNELGTDHYGVSFFADSERFVDTVVSVKDAPINYNGDKVTVYQDFSLEEKHLLTGINICKVDGYTFFKVITPFTRARSYDFLIARNDEAEDILKILSERSKKKNFRSVDIPTFGIDYETLKKETTDFLLNEEFRKFCEERMIPLKRGIVMEGAPGNGKSMSIRWIKDMALKNDIDFEIFDNPKKFVDNKDHYFSDRKKIFVFEDFDSALMDRSKNGTETPDQVLAQVLNSLEGVDNITNTVTIFTTNQIDVFDRALMRPGRVDRVIRFDGPDEEVAKKFFSSYAIDITEDDINKLVGELFKQDTRVSYALLKGISDDINIHIFNEGSIEYPKIEEIAMKKIKGANKGKEVKDYKNYVL